jgi:hypothetical protein
MLESFILLKNSIQKYFIDLNHPVRFEDSDYNLITEIIDVLAPIKLIVQVIRRCYVNFYTADTVFKISFKGIV